MEYDDDVGRLFSWLKTPDLHYREFADEREVADAAAAWPALRNAAPETTRSETTRSEDVAAAAAGLEPPPAPVPPGSPREPLGERLRAALGRPPAPPRNGPTFHDVVIPPAARENAPPSPDTDTAERYDEARYDELREPAAPAEPPRSETPDREPAAGREALFGGAYRGFENEDVSPAPPPPAESQGNRSLDDVFSRLAQADGGYREERRPRPGSSGLGPVFRRLR